MGDFLAGVHGILFRKTNSRKAKSDPLNYEFTPLPRDKHVQRARNDKEGWQLSTSRKYV